jgi:FlaA1/EpsC-like NDP-sugar epimerase
MRFIILFLISSASLLFALCLRFDFATEEIFLLERLWKPLLLLAFCRWFAYSFFRILSASWKHFGTHDAMRVVKAQLLSSLMFTAGLVFFHILYFPRSVVVIEGLLSLFLVIGIKVLFRLHNEKKLSSSSFGLNSPVRNIVIVGAGDSGHRLVRLLQAGQSHTHKILGIFDDNKALKGNLVHGVPVLGALTKLPEFINANLPLHRVIIAIPSLPVSKTELIIKTCIAHNVECKRIRTIDDIAVENFSLNEEGTDALIEVLMQKELHPYLPEKVISSIEGKRILITGGGGSIGSEIVRQLCDASPASLIIVDSSEYNLFKLENELKFKFPSAPLHFILADIRDEKRIETVFKQYQPQLIYHAAAYKHVPITEGNPQEAFKTNTFGTLLVLNKAIELGVERFVMISTDKAVDPVNILGLTKRLAELLVAAVCKKVQSEGRPFSAASVRFGNVINSTGSVIPTFRNQILQGLHITVTHPEAERYFMTTQEAAQLVICAGSLAKKGEIFALDMGKKVKILDVAERMKTLLGKKELPIVFIGLRPGERLSEEITATKETALPTEFPKIFCVQPQQIDTAFPSSIIKLAEQINSYTNQETLLEIQARLSQIENLS